MYMYTYMFEYISMLTCMDIYTYTHRRCTIQTDSKIEMYIDREEVEVKSRGGNFQWI